MGRSRLARPRACRVRGPLAKALQVGTRSHTPHVSLLPAGGTGQPPVRDSSPTGCDLRSRFTLLGSSAQSSCLPCATTSVSPLFADRPSTCTSTTRRCLRRFCPKRRRDDRRTRRTATRRSYHRPASGELTFQAAEAGAMHALDTLAGAPSCMAHFGISVPPMDVPMDIGTYQRTLIGEPLGEPVPPSPRPRKGAQVVARGCRRMHYTRSMRGADHTQHQPGRWMRLTPKSQY
jgi:hypothetical protein